jgi:hypothetical protein
MVYNGFRISKAQKSFPLTRGQSTTSYLAPAGGGVWLTARVVQGAPTLTKRGGGLVWALAAQSKTTSPERL